MRAITHTAPPRPRARWLPKLDRRELAAIYAGGAVGTLARAGLSAALPHSPTAWPWATFIVNIVAAALLGYFRHPVAGAVAGYAAIHVTTAAVRRVRINR